MNSYAKSCLDRLIPQLTGLTINGGLIDDTGEFWGFVAEGKEGRKTVRKVVFVMTDPEGNGPGFLEISRDPEPSACAGKAGCVGEAPAGICGDEVVTPPRFPLGRVVATPGAIEALEANGAQGAELLGRHVRGDWGDLCEEDRQANEEALEQGLRLLSAFRLPDGTRIWIITEADRSVTTLLLPEEY